MLECKPRGNRHMSFEELYELAFSVSKEVHISKDAEIGSVGAAIESESGHVYIGKNIDMSCALGMCAERNAISTMLTTETSHIMKLVCVHKSGKVILPCGACAEFLKHLEDITKDTEILVSLHPLKTIKLKDISPYYWRDQINGQIKNSEIKAKK